MIAYFRINARKCASPHCHFIKPYRWECATELGVGIELFGKIVAKLFAVCKISLLSMNSMILILNEGSKSLSFCDKR